MIWQDDVSGFLDRKLFLTWYHRYHFAENVTTKSPSGNGAGTASLVVNGSVLTTHIGADDVAEPLPGFSLKPHELQLRKRGKVAGAGVDLDARQQAAQLKPFYAGRLLRRL